MTRWQYTGRSKTRFYKLFGDPQDKESAIVRPFDGWQLHFESDTGETVVFNTDTTTYEISCPVTGLLVYNPRAKSIADSVDKFLLVGKLIDRYVDAIASDLWDDIKERYAKLCNEEVQNGD